MNDPLRRLVESTLIPHTAFQTGLDRLNQCYHSMGGGDSIVINVLGDSRCGKSSLVEHFESQHRPSRGKDGMFTPIVRIRTPSQPQEKSLAHLILTALQDPISYTRVPEYIMNTRLVTLLKGSGTRVLILDEIQHFTDRWSDKVVERAADWLKNLVDEAGIMLVLVGLPYSISMLHLNKQLAGRSLAPIIIPTFDWHTKESRIEFCALLDAFKDAIDPFSVPDLGSEEMAFRFYMASGGVIGHVAKLLRQTTWDVLDVGHTSITIEDLETGFARSRLNTVNGIQVNPFSRDFSLAMDAPPVMEPGDPETPLVLEQPKRRGRKPGPTDKLKGIL